MRRVPIKGLLHNEETRRELFINSIMTIQNREGIPTTREQAEEAYNKIQQEKKKDKP